MFLGIFINQRFRKLAGERVGSDMVIYLEFDLNSMPRYG